MKNLFILLSISLLFSCKEKFTPAPVVGPPDFVFKEFSVPGVSNENILFLDHAIVVKLPANYPGGNVIRPSVKFKNGFSLETDLSQGLEFQGKTLMISAISDVYGSFPYTICVIPAESPTFVRNQQNYEKTIQSNSVLTIPVDIPGTAVTTDEKNDLVSVPVITVEEKGSGNVSNWKATLDRDITGKTSVTMYVPTNAEVGEFEVTMEWGRKKTVIPDPVVLKRGRVEIGGFTYFTKESDKVNIPGVNLAFESKYEIVLENDFIQSRKITLDRLDFNNLQLPVPADLPVGNYKATIFVNGKEYDNNPFKFAGFANLYYKTSNDQPVLAIISKPSLRDNSTCSFYTPSRTASRNEEMIVNALVSREESDQPVNVRMVNLKTKKSYLLDSPVATSSGACGTFQIYHHFKISDQIPDGDYEVNALVGFNPNDNPAVSEKYAQIIALK